MVGRRTNRWRDEAEDAAAVEPPPPALCALCQRALGQRIEHHHLIPKSEGGRETVALHPICHGGIHAALDNKTLARSCRDVDALRARPELAGFLAWIADKPADFHAATRRGGASDGRRR